MTRDNCKPEMVIEVLVPTSLDGIRNRVRRDALTTCNPNIVLIQSRWNPVIWSVTHRHSGLAFFSDVPGKSLARTLAAILSGMQPWNHKTAKGVINSYKKLPILLRSWIVQGQRDWGTRKEGQ